MWQPEARSQRVAAWDFTKLRFEATSQVRDSPLGQEIAVTGTVTNPGPDTLVLGIPFGCAIRMGVVPEANPEVYIEEPDGACPDYSVNEIIPSGTALVPRHYRSFTLTRALLGDSMPDGPYRIEPELILLGPDPWREAKVKLRLEAGRAYLKRPP
jgi:hypothetical protein